mgnify:CR=1 FL=1
MTENMASQMWKLPQHSLGFASALQTFPWFKNQIGMLAEKDVANTDAYAHSVPPMNSDKQRV